MIWGKGLNGWTKIEAWLGDLTSVAAAAPEAEKEESQPVAWHFALNGKSHGPFDKSTLVHELKHTSNLAEVMVWTKGMKEWAPIFEFHELLTAIGVNKRQFPRADISGRATIKTSESTLVAEILSISEGGVGVHLSSGLVAGQSFSLEIESSVFRTTIHAKAECRFISEGICGIRFMNLSDEAKGAIIQLVRENQPRFVLKAA